MQAPRNGHLTPGTTVVQTAYGVALHVSNYVSEKVAVAVVNQATDVSS